ncbi:cytochrome P450 306a1-like [Zophobas morio]|uniref:cytochrome P450 306a1-like n=1 Tax=Zophobas morio TaxID=2755281 RepID=UPI003083B7E5
MLTTALFVAVATTALFLLCIYIHRKTASLPGPWNLPILGCLHKLDTKLPYLTLTELAQKYGPIYSIKLGLLEAVVISDAKLLKKILVKDEALGRPPMYVFSGVFKGKGIAYAPMHLWRDQRKFVSNFLRTSGAAKFSSKKKTLENIIKKYVEEFMELLNSQGEKTNLNPSEAIGNYVISVASTMFLGKSFNRGDKIRKTLLDSYDKVTKLLAVGGPINFLPFLRFLPQYKHTISSLTKYVEDVHHIQNQCIEMAEKCSSNNSEDEYLNLIEAFFQQKLKCDSEEIYNTEQLQFLLFDVFGASIETTSNTLFWILLYLAKYQNVQNKVRNELNNVLQNKSLQMEDLQNLPYTHATISEVSRIRTVVPLGFPHYALEDIQIENFKIPKGCMILSLLWAIHMDQKFWKNPEEFSPDRFLDDEGRFLQLEAFLPFQTGKRMCVGEELGKMMMFLFVATVVKNFKIEACNSGDVDFSPICGLTLLPKPQELVFTKI